MGAKDGADADADEDDDNKFCSDPVVVELDV
jgi:hypothetical protein